MSAGFAVTRPTMAQARRLCEMVDAIDFHQVAWWDDLEGAWIVARQLGAHSVARALTWSMATMGNDEAHTGDVERRVRDVAERWLYRMERLP